MNILQALKKIKKSPFKMPKKTYYFGKLQYGTPYFWPIGFCASIFSIRKLKLSTDKNYQAKIKNRGIYVTEAYKKEIRFSNLPIARRTTNRIIELFGNSYYIELGSPFAVNNNDLGWKDKYDTPRFEWAPAFQLFFFKWQFCVWLNSPCEDRTVLYWEMLLWYLYYADEDIAKAEETWNWIDHNTKNSTWNKNFLK